METSLGKKPYKFVPFNQTKRSETVVHNKFVSGTFSGKFKITIKTLTPIHISASIKNIENKELINKFIRTDGKIVIPGSSLKGMIRSIFEAISSCTPSLPNNTKALESALPNKKEDKCDDSKNLCPSCSVFGMAHESVGYKSKIVFSQFNLKNQRPDSFENIKLPAFKAPFSDYPRYKENYNPTNKPKCFMNVPKGYGNERIYYADLLDNEEKYDTFTKSEYFKLIEGNYDRSIKFRGRKFYLHNIDGWKNLIVQNKGKFEKYEMIKKGQEFNGFITFENLSEEELSILALVFSFGSGDNFKYKLGYAKPAYFGSVDINVDEIINGRFNKINMDSELLQKLADNYKNQVPKETKYSINKLAEILSTLDMGKSWEDNNGYKVY